MHLPDSCAVILSRILITVGQSKFVLFCFDLYLSEGLTLNNGLGCDSSIHLRKFGPLCDCGYNWNEL